MFGILEAAAVSQPDVFNTYEDLFANLNERMRKQGYKIVKSRSQRSRLGGAGVPGNEIVRCDLVCDRGGRPYKSVATKHKTSTKKTGCPWRAKAVRRKLINGWTLSISCDQHNHEPGTPEDSVPNSPILDASGIDNSDIDIDPERELDPEHDLNLGMSPHLRSRKLISHEAPLTQSSQTSLVQIRTIQPYKLQEFRIWPCISTIKG